MITSWQITKGRHVCKDFGPYHQKTLNRYIPLLIMQNMLSYNALFCMSFTGKSSKNSEFLSLELEREAMMLVLVDVINGIEGIKVGEAVV